MSKILSYLFLLIILVGCDNIQKDNNSVLLAKAYDSYLYISDIKDIIPKNVTERDSIAFVRNYSRDWVKTQVMIYQAKLNLLEDELNFDKQLEDYRNSLVIYKYETKLIKQNLDTVVSDVEIKNYYNTHLNDFELKENITKAAYVIIDTDSVNEKIFTSVFNLHDTLFFDSLSYYGDSLALSTYIDTATWISFVNIQKVIPIETYNSELFLKNNKPVTIVTNHYTYFLKFFDFKIKDDISPLQFKKNDIYNIIISRRKMKLAKEVREKIYNRALNSNNSEIFYQE